MCFREIPEFEHNAMTSAMNNIFHCNISALPAQVTTHSFFAFIHTVLNNKEYSQCLKGKTSWRCSGPFARKMCRTRVFLNRESKAKINGLTLPECHELMSDIQDNKPLNIHMEKIYNRSKIYRSKPKEEIFKDLFGTVKNYTECMDEVKVKGTQCHPQLQKHCNGTSVRAIKAIRLRMRTIKQMLDGDQNMLAVLMFRDPRGTIASRFKSGFVSANSRRKKVREAEMLCKKMEEDLKTYSDMLMRSDYDDRIMILKYENVVQDPRKAAKRVYWNLLKENVPNEVHLWLNSSIAGDKDSGAMGTVRKNGTETANKWMQSLTVDEISNITVICKPILEKLGYPVDL